jgi:hypothetical protein
MGTLRRAHHVEQSRGAQRPHPVPQRGQIGRRVPETAVALAHDERKRLAVPAGEAGGKDAERALARDQQAL